MSNKASWLKKTFKQYGYYNIYFKSFYVVNSRRFWFYEDIPKKDVDKAICYSYIKGFTEHVLDGDFLYESPAFDFNRKNTNHVMWFQSLFNDIKDVYLNVDDLGKYSSLFLKLSESIFAQILLASAQGHYVHFAHNIVAMPFKEDVLAIECDLTLDE